MAGYQVLSFVLLRLSFVLIEKSTKHKVRTGERLHRFSRSGITVINQFSNLAGQIKAIVHCAVDPVIKH
jgi:hypothetical protein